MDVKGKRVFISGPMTGHVHYNATAFVDAHIMLNASGARDVYDPAVEWLRWHGPRRTHDEWMRDCINELTAPDVYDNTDVRYWDVLVSLPGWEGSEGARTEREVAKAIGMEVCDLSEVA